MTHFNRIRGSRCIKIIAVLLSAISITAAFILAATAIQMYECDFYTNKTYSDIRTEMLTSAALKKADIIYRIADIVWDKKSSRYEEYEIINSYVSAYKENIYYELSVDGDVVATNADTIDGEIIHTEVVEGVYGGRGRDHVTGTVKIFIPDKLIYKDDLYFIENAMPKLYEARYAIPTAGAAALIIAVVTYIFALASAGVRKDTDEIALSWFDKIPFDLTLAAAFAAGCAEFVIFDYNYDIGMIFSCLLFAAYVFIDSIIITLISMSFVVRVRKNTIIRNNVLVIGVRAIFRLLRKIGKFIVHVFRCLPMFWRTLIVCAVIFFCNLLAFVWAIDSDEAGIFMFIIVWLAVAALACYSAVCMSKLRRGTEKIAAGDTDHKISTGFLISEYGKQARAINNIGDGISRAVEEKMKGERFKAELITNVSHDLKTPITSIINYIDLLDREDLENENAREYIDVLKRQSERLRRLTDDLVDASKASSGAMPVNSEPMDLGMFVSQTEGEFRDRMEKSELTLIVKKPDEPVYIRADGRLMSRVLDNLMVNVCKYAMSGTRVYMTLSENAENAVLTLTNISRDVIDVPGGELVERFVRGDASRHTEGSGLGLSIAKSLCDLQNVMFYVDTDSDLFRVTLIAKRIAYDNISEKEPM